MFPDELFLCFCNLGRAGGVARGGVCIVVTSQSDRSPVLILSQCLFSMINNDRTHFLHYEPFNKFRL